MTPPTPEELLRLARKAWPEDERWLPVVGFPGYEVSDLGRVRCWRPCNRLARQPSEPRILRTPPNKTTGYISVSLYLDRREYRKLVHRLVLEAFVGPCPEGHEARHVHDPDPTNARLDNLAWGTKAENMQDQIRHGSIARGMRNGWCRLTDEQVSAIRESGLSASELAKLYKVSPGYIWQIRVGLARKHSPQRKTA